MAGLEHLVMKVREAAARGIGALSTGEALAAALVLNRADWLAEMNYTIAEALDRIEDDWIALIPAVARMIADTDAIMADVRTAAREETALARISSPSDEIELRAKLITYGHAPGYRDTSLTFDVQRFGAPTAYRICIRLTPSDGESVVRNILEVHRWAWRNGRPLDIQEGEQRPRWIDNP